MRMRSTLFALCGLLGVLAACATPQQETEIREDLLRKAGFVAKPANTPERIQMMRSMPPNTFMKGLRGNETVFLYADPKVCGCLYVGTEAEFLRYKQQAVQSQLMDEQSLDPQLHRAASWRWGAWDPGWIY